MDERTQRKEKAMGFVRYLIENSNLLNGCPKEHFILVRLRNETVDSFEASPAFFPLNRLEGFQNQALAKQITDTCVNGAVAVVGMIIDRDPMELFVATGVTVSESAGGDA